MPTITRLVQGKKNPNRVNLYLDDQFAFALSLDEVAKHALKKGLELSKEKVESLKDKDEIDYVYAKILNFLSYRPRTVKEVRDRLYKYEVRDKSKQDLLIAKLESHGYLDDLKFATWFIESRNTHRPRSKAMLKQELSAKGISKDIVESALVGRVDESATITRLLDKKLGVRRTLDRAATQKIYAYLSRQGFAWDKIVMVVKTWQSE
ncbi:MAG: RecX family transcriptional regulator [Microgenomates group bacterium]